MRYCLNFLFLVALIIQPLVAQQALTLRDCLQAAYQSNHLLKAANYQEQQAALKLRLSQAQRLPTAHLATGYTRIARLSTIEYSTKPGEPPRKLTFGTPNRVNFALRVQMPLFTWWRIDHSIKLAQHGVLLNSLQKEKQKVKVTAQVLQAYFGALLGKKMVELTKQNVQRTQKYLEITQKRYQSGQLPKLELLRAQVQMKNQQIQLQTAQAEYQKSLVFLARVTGKSANTIEPAGELEFKPLMAREEAFFAMARQNRVELKQLEQQQSMLNVQQRMAAAGNKPSLGLVSDYSVMNGFNPMDPEKFYTNYSIGLQLNWPLFDAFNARFTAQQVHYNQMALSEQEKDIEENIRLQIRQALISLAQASQKIESQKANIDLAKEALNLAQKQYNQGLISSLDLLDAQKALLLTEMSYWQAVFSHLRAKIELAKAVGNFSIFEDQM